MKRILVIALIIYSSTSWCQDKSFLNTDTKRLVVEGDVVTIKTDTAYILNKSTAEFLNQKLDELASVKMLYNDIVDNRNHLLTQLTALQIHISKLSTRMDTDHLTVDENLAEILNSLDVALDDLKNNNKVLKKNNDDLQNQVNQLERITKKLRKEIRHIWWNGLIDKLVAFGVGIAAGALIVSIL